MSEVSSSSTFSGLRHRVSPHLRRLSPYTPGTQPNEQEWIKLNTNECPYPPSPRVSEILSHLLCDQAARLRLYPDPSCLKLRQLIARQNQAPESHVLCGNGSDELLKLLVQVFTDGERSAAMLDPSYSLYPVLANAHGIIIHRVILEPDMHLPVQELCELDANLILLTCPHAPTGVAFKMEEMEELARSTGAILVFDEAYSAFAPHDALPLLKKYPNVCITRTLSKSHSLAGLRFGYLLAHPAIISQLDAARDVYNVDTLAQEAAYAAIEDEAYFRETVQKVIATRERVRSWFQTKGWFVYPSSANFLFVEPRHPKVPDGGAELAADLFEYLQSRKILVRTFPHHRFTCRFLRISIGSDSEMNTLQQAIDQWELNA